MLKSNEKEGKLIDGKDEALKLIQDLKEKIKKLANFSIIPNLAIILVGENPESKLYVNIKIQKAEELGLKIKLFHLEANVTENELINLINTLNKDVHFHGILIQMPLPNHINKINIVSAINYNKDVDGFTPMNMGLLALGKPNLIPCTALGVFMLLKKIFPSNSIIGKNVVIIGRSIIVGRPLSLLLSNADCSVTILHSKSIEIEKITKNADILIVAIGKAQLINKNFIKKGSCVIDVGITKVIDEIKGDVNFEEVIDIVSHITPVPGGVGPMTVACLMHNTIKAAYKANNIDFKDYKL